MAGLSQVTLELKVTGERQATDALKKFAEAGNKVGTSVGQLGRKLASIEDEYKKIIDLNKRGIVTDEARAGAISKLVAQLRSLTGISGDEARAALQGAQAARDKAQADKRAAQAAEQHARSQKNLEGSVLKQSRAVDQAASRMEELSRLQAKGATGTRDMAQAEIEIARALARTNGYLKANGALNTQKALAELKAARETRENNAELQRAEQGYDRLMASINPVIAKQQAMRKAHDTIRAALKTEIITRDQAAQALREYRAAQQSTNAAINAAGTQYIPQTKRQTSQLGVVFQQAGYQIGDFAVQVQSGTNYMVAMGQQLTQLVGVGAMLAKSTRWIAAFSALGILVPITTAIVGGFLRARDAADEAETEVRTLSDTISSLNTIQRTVASDFENGLNAAFAESANNVSRLLDQLREAEFRAAMQPLKDSFDEVTIGVDRLDAALNMMVGFNNAINSGQELSRQQEDLLEQSRKMVEENLSLAIAYDDVKASLDAITESGSTQELITNFAKALEIAEALPGPIADELVDSLLEAAREAGLLEQIISQSEGAAKDTADAASGISQELSVAVVMANNLASALSRAAAAGVARQRQIAVLQAQIGAAQSGVSQEVAGVRAGTEFDVSQAGADPIISRAAGAIAEAEARQIEQLEETLGVLNTPPDEGSGSTGGGVGGGTQEWVSLFPELQAAYEEAEKLAKQYKDEVEILDSALENGLITQQQYNAHLAEAQEYYGQAGEAATEYEKILLMMAETTSDALGDAMMDIVTGTKSVADAFTDMTQIILKKAFELLVINPILNSIFGGIPGFNLLPSLVPGSTSANGNIFSAGNVQPFATGGVVGSPTYFPMSNGNVGLMGEAGPEAIMPLKRGKGGRLGVEVNGEQGNVTVNQTFAFQANGDDSVKKIIAQEAPKIAALTQKQILDSRRRGGVVRDTFS